MPSRKRGLETMIRVSVGFGNSSTSPIMDDFTRDMQNDRVSHFYTFLKKHLLDITKEHLDLEFAQRNDIAMAERLFHMGVDPAPVDIGAIG